MPNKPLHQRSTEALERHAEFEIQCFLFGATSFSLQPLGLFVWQPAAVGNEKAADNIAASISLAPCSLNLRREILNPIRIKVSFPVLLCLDVEDLGDHLIGRAAYELAKLG